MKLKRLPIYLFCFLSPILFHGQINISNKVQESSIVTTQENALYFVDFWATWCRPCIHVSKYLESLQKQYPEKFYILSLSQESPEVVNRFMTKHEIGLAVALDYDGQTFTENNISSLPYGILFNAEGKKLWEGHAADLKPYNIEGYLESNKKTVSVNTFFKLKKYKEQAEIVKPIIRKKDFDFLEIKNEGEIFSNLQVIHKAGYIELNGNLQDIIAYALKSNKNQVEIPAHLNKYYSLYFKEGTEAFNDKEFYILKALKLERTNSEREGEVFVFDVKSPNFWDTSQIDWGVGNPKYLIGDSEIQADNVSLNDIAYQLSYLLEKPVVFNNKNDDDKLHDWQIHYKYFELMSSNLNEYGIKVKKELVAYPHYVYSEL